MTFTRPVGDLIRGVPGVTWKNTTHQDHEVALLRLSQESSNQPSPRVEEDTMYVCVCMLLGPERPIGRWNHQSEHHAPPKKGQIMP